MLARIILLVLVGFKLSCGNQEKAEPQGNKPIARVNGQYLYQKDLAHLKLDKANPQDTVGLVDRYIQSWIAKQLLIAKAESAGSYDKAGIERKILDYKYALIAHSFIEELVKAQLDKNISEEELSSYYEYYQENFRLKHNLVRGKFVVIPKDTPNQEGLKKLLNATQKTDKAALETYCSQFAKAYTLDDTNWLNWNEVITQFLPKKLNDKKRLLKKTNCLEIQDDLNKYYLKIDAYKLIDDIAPIELVKHQIQAIILYKRKLTLANQLKEELLQQAKDKHNYTIYGS